MKQVLMIASEFPPQKLGNDRIVKFVKYLSDYDYKPLVLTVSNKGVREFDYSLEEQIPEDVTVYRAFYPNILLYMERFKLRIKGKGIDSKKSVVKEKSTGSNLHPKTNFIKKALVYTLEFLRRYILIPEELITWLPFAVIKGIIACRKEKVDILFSTAPYYVNHLVALVIKTFRGKKWVADYRNLWTDNPLRQTYSSFRKRLEERLDQLVLRRCDRIVVIAPSMKRALLKRYPFILPEKIICIDNGYDLSDFDPILENKSERKDKFLITYTGAVYRNYPIESFLSVVGEIIKERPENKELIMINFIGTFYGEEKEKARKAIQKYNLSKIVSFINRVPRKDALRYQVNSDLLLLMLTNRGRNIETVVPGKLFEYIAIKKPILAIVPDGDAKEIIEKGRCGIAVNPQNREGIKMALLRFIEDYHKGNLSCSANWNYLKRYDRRELTRRLSLVFSELIISKEHGYSPIKIS